MLRVVVAQNVCNIRWHTILTQFLRSDTFKIVSNSNELNGTPSTYVLLDGTPTIFSYHSQMSDANQETIEGNGQTL